MMRDILSSRYPLSKKAVATLTAAVVPLLKLPWLSVRLRRQARERPEGDAPVLVPLLTRQSAALPSEQGH